MKCLKCKESLVFKDPNYCKKHFLEYVETKVKDTIKEFNMLSKKDKVAVGCSGGKDSLTLLYILKKLNYDVTAISVDEGIDRYRDPEFKHTKDFCEKYDVPLETYSFKEAFGKTLDQMDTKSIGGMPCTTCGSLRRYLLNKGSKGFTKIAVGHNMDDEAQAILMNLFKGQVEIMKRQGPITTNRKEFTQRIKPLYYLKEKEIATYAFLQDFIEEFVECPNAKLAYRIHLRDILNVYETANSGTKENIVKHFLEYKKNWKQSSAELLKCKECGEAASKEICKACQIRVKL